MKRLQLRADQLARVQQRRQLERMKQAAGESLVGVSAEVEGNLLVLRGRGLVRRWLADPALRWIGRFDR